MKKLSFVIFLFILLSCKNNLKDTKLLDGVWGESEKDNALFVIKNDTLRYVEYYETPYLAQIVKNKLVIKYLDNKVLSESYILKISKDSLVLKTDDEPSLKLYNRRE